MTCICPIDINTGRNPPITLLEELSPFIIIFGPNVLIYAAQFLVAKLRKLRHLLFLSFVVVYLSVMILYTVAPSLVIARNRERAITQFIGSSTTCTVVETDDDKKFAKETSKEADESKRAQPRHGSFSQRLAFNRLGSSFKMAVSRTRSKSIVDSSLAHRISPARRMSSRIVTAIHTVSHRLHHDHTCHNDDSFFSEQPAKAKKVAETVVVNSTATVETPEASILVDDVVREKEEAEREAGLGNGELKALPNIGSSSPKEPKAFRRIVRRASTTLSFTRRS